MPVLEKREGGLALSRDGAVAIVWLHRPEKLNALARGFWASFQALLDELAADHSCRAIVLTGSGDRAFCAGGDIASFDALGDEGERRAFQRDCMDAFTAIERLPLPVIAAVNGLALGGGCELALACDMVIAADTAQFGMPEANLGLVPGYGILRAPGVIGRQWTNWMVMGGERIGAEQALAIGLVQKVLPQAELLERAVGMAQRIAGLSRTGMATAKALVGGRTADDQVEASIEAITALHGGGDGEEGRRAFLERRAPVFGD